MNDEINKNASTEDAKRGGIKVETQHIFPIIKKWLYSDKDIFLREIVSNASDAITKLKRLDSLREFNIPEGESLRVTVELDKDAGILTVTDNGIGMTAEELEKYICSIALSGALEFIQKYEKEDGSSTSSNGIIGHFGLGFYSSFMVADTVEIDTLSYTGGKAVHWACTEAGEYEITDSDRTERGTSVIMHITDAEKEYLAPYKIREILEKYCAFMPVPVFYDDGAEEEAEEDKSDEKKSAEPKEPKPINDILPLWARPASEITEEEYNSFYHKLFNDYEDPLFYIHINADYPLNFRGILYFPKIKNENQSLEGEVKLYYNQVFVADNIKEVLPDYLLMLKGALDCPDLPLNVSRSYLQDNQYVKRIAQFIVKKVADKLNSLRNTDREKYEKVYNDIKIFIEYACIRDRKFYDRVADSLILRLTDGKFKTIDEYLTKPEDEAQTAENTSSDEDKKDDAAKKPEGTVYYATDTALQTQYIKMLTDAGVEVAVFDMLLDAQYLTSLEEYRSGLKFVRVDSDISAALNKDEASAAVPEDVIAVFRKISGSEKLEVKAEKMKNSDVPAVLLVSEQSRRFEEMMKLYTAPGQEAPAFPVDYTLTLNTASPLYSKLINMSDEKKPELDTFASFIYRLSLLAQKKLTATELSDFLSDSYKLLSMI